MNYDDYCRIQVKGITPTIKPCADPCEASPFLLSPTTESQEVLGKEVDPLLAVLLQQNCRQSQMIKALKEELRELKRLYDDLQSQGRPRSILDQALEIRKRSFEEQDTD